MFDNLVGKLTSLAILAVLVAAAVLLWREVIGG
jgi:hypothetical protein